MNGAAVIERVALRAIVVLALVATAITTAGCDDGPKRNKEFHTYPEYKAAALGLEHDHGEDEIDLSDDGDFGPTADSLPTTSADEIRGGVMAGLGSLKGVVTYSGPVPKRKRFDLSKDPWVASNHEVLSEELVVNEQNRIRDVVVFISKGVNRFDFDPPGTPALLDQNGCQYEPHVLTMMAGQELAIKNSDDTSHNYHFIGSANEEINKTQPKPTTDSIYSLTEPDLNATFKCDIHGWMSAPTYIFDHPYFAVTDENGAFEIRNIPPGEYEISFLHQRGSVKYPAQAVSITADSATEITVQ